jgi:hypothetical protein
MKNDDSCVGGLPQGPGLGLRHAPGWRAEQALRSVPAAAVQEERAGGTGRRNGALFRDRVQFCSGLVDLVVGVPHRSQRLTVP